MNSMKKSYKLLNVDVDKKAELILKIIHKLKYCTQLNIFIAKTFACVCCLYTLFCVPHKPKKISSNQKMNRLFLIL